MPAKVTTLRSLGLLEKYQISKSLAECYGTVNLAAHIKHATSRPAQDEQTWYLSRFVPAIQQICNEEPYLTTIVAMHNTSDAHWTQLEKLDALDIVDFRSISFQECTSLDELISEECRYEFNLGDNTKPLWRLCIATDPKDLTRSVVIFTWNHVIGDGMSSTTFFDRFLELLNQGNVTEGTNTAIQVKEVNKLPLPYDQRSSPKPNLITDVIPKAVNELLLPKFITRRMEAEKWGGHHKAKEEKHKSVVRTLEFCSDRLVTRCKQEQVSPHCALYIAAIMAASSELMDGPGKLVTATPINARSLCKPEIPKDEIGNFVGSFENPVRVPLKGSFWDEARLYRHKLKVGRRDASMVSQYLAYLGPYPNEWIKYSKSPFKKCKMGRDGGFELSDLALWKNKSGNGEWNLEKATFCQSINVYGVFMCMNAITVGNILRTTIVWQDGVADVDRIDKFIARIKQTLTEQCQ
ncbi:Alcohol acetyltransferase [Umbelopsis nana]